MMTNHPNACKEKNPVNLDRMSAYHQMNTTYIYINELSVILLIFNNEIMDERENHNGRTTTINTD